MHESVPVLLMRWRTVGLMIALMAARLEAKLGMRLAEVRLQAGGHSWRGKPLTFNTREVRRHY